MRTGCHSNGSVSRTSGRRCCTCFAATISLSSSPLFPFRGVLLFCKQNVFNVFKNRFPCCRERDVAHGAVGRWIDTSWGEPIELFFAPASASRLV